jgi:hypothetical protein
VRKNWEGVRRKTRHNGCESKILQDLSPSVFLEFKAADLGFLRPHEAVKAEAMKMRRDSRRCPPSPEHFECHL